MESIVMNAHAKINLALDVLGRRGDGYHDLRMVMQSVSLCDEVMIRKTDDGRLRLTADTPHLPADENNLAYQAALYCQKEWALNSGLLIELRKVIPISAGLAGGSSDCAAVLAGVNRLFHLGLPLRTLMAIGARFGADVPFCLMGGTALAEGIGDKLTPAAPLPEIFIVIAKPPFPVSTAAVFKDFQPERVSARPDIPSMLKSLEKGDIGGITAGLCNVLESVTLRQYPEISRLKQIILEFGALGALMSGSGPSVFGFFDNYRESVSAVSNMRRKLSHEYEIFLTVPAL